MDEFRIKTGDREHYLKLKKVADGEYEVVSEDSIYEISIVKRAKKTSKESHVRKENDVIYVDSVIGGIVLKISKKAGVFVSEGDTVMTLIAMKTETDIKAPEKGLLSKIAVYEGMIVEKGELLFVIDTK